MWKIKYQAVRTDATWTSNCTFDNYDEAKRTVRTINKQSGDFYVAYVIEWPEKDTEKEKTE